MSRKTKQKKPSWRQGCNQQHMFYPVHTFEHHYNPVLVQTEESFSLLNILPLLCVLSYNSPLPTPSSSPLAPTLPLSSANMNQTRDGGRTERPSSLISFFFFLPFSKSKSDKLIWGCDSGCVAEAPPPPHPPCPCGPVSAEDILLAARRRCCLSWANDECGCICAAAFSQGICKWIARRFTDSPMSHHLLELT